MFVPVKRAWLPIIKLSIKSGGGGCRPRYTETGIGLQSVIAHFICMYNKLFRNSEIRKNFIEFLIREYLYFQATNMNGTRKVGLPSSTCRWGEKHSGPARAFGLLSLPYLSVCISIAQYILPINNISTEGLSVPNIFLIPWGPFIVND